MPPRKIQVPSGPPPILPAVQAAAGALTLAPEDAAAVALAEQYASCIDTAQDPADALDRLGPKLLAVLAALGATPAARKAVLTGGASGAVSKLEQLRAARRQA